MHINVSDILAESVGYSREYVISDEQPILEGLTLTKAVSGRIAITRLDEGVAVRGRLTTEVELECDRCLRSFTHPVTVSLRQVFIGHPGDDQLPISHGVIDLDPLVEQEIIVGLPIKLLCQPDCPGIRETKGNLSGRTQET
jgi:DUF177 domain-containing protein